jgi:hypothetical protein
MYKSGGWMASPGSCSIGFKSRPSATAGRMRRKGLEVNRMNSKKPKATRQRVPSTRASMGAGNCREKRLTRSIQKVSIRSQRSSEPSWPPQTPAMR